MRPAFSNTSYFFTQNFLLLTYQTKLFGGFETPKKFEDFKCRFFYNVEVKSIPLIMSRLKVSNQLDAQPRLIAKEIASTFRSYVARHLHFVASYKKGTSLFPCLFLG